MNGYYILLVFLLLLIILPRMRKNNKMIEITIDGNVYKVKNNYKKHMEKVGSLLHKMWKKTQTLCDYIELHYSESEYKRLLRKRNVKFEEINPKYEGEAAYSINKGEKIGICVYNKNRFILDENTMFFVVMHELAHVMSVKYAHDKEFWNNFSKLIDISEKIGLYQYQDYNEDSETFCGHEITNNPYKK